MTEHPVVVVGGGLIGCFTAFYLADKGRRVVLLERDQLGAGASTGNCGYVCPSHVFPLAVPGAVGRTLRTMLRRDSPIAVTRRPSAAMVAWFARFATRCSPIPMLESATARHRLLVASKGLYRDLVDRDVLACDWRETGLLIVHRSRKGFLDYRPTADRLRDEFGVRVRSLEGDELCGTEPMLKAGLGGGWLFEDDVQVDPGLLMTSLRRALTQRGVELRERCSVSSLTLDSGAVTAVNTDQGSINPSAVVVCTGAEAPSFAKPLGCTLPIQPGKGYSITVDTEGTGPRVPMIFEESHVAVSPLAGALRIGSTMEFAGYDRRINARRLGLLERSAREHLREVPDLAGARTWSGWRPMVYDGVPCIDRSPAAANAVIAAGNGMIGLATAPATGQLAASLATGDAPPIDPAPYRVARFRRAGRVAV